MAEIPAAAAAAEEGKVNGGATIHPNPTEPIGSKRQCRPSVRLGDIGGDTPYDSHPRWSTKPWKLGFEHHRRDSNNASGKPSKTRPLTNFSFAEFGGETLEDHDDRDAAVNVDSVVIGSWKVKDSKKRGSAPAPTKRVRSNWVPRMDDGGGGEDGEDKFFSGSSEGEDKFYSGGDEGDDYDGNKRSVRARVSEGREKHEGIDGIEISGPSNNDIRDRNDNNGVGRRGRYGEDGVRVWLNGLGLGRYAPVFKIHEVDDEVLSLLTLEDIKDMGINAVGSRRKMYCVIHKLGKGFS
ncbi:hypothetical protein RIF29_10649 [Crotalaria pallida]|uniref:SAM domain-containing protein n=1 Tax=Crotalaria pallida TaxID=3830 RepID=A0AAN9FVF3_CROPI